MYIGKANLLTSFDKAFSLILFLYVVWFGGISNTMGAGSAGFTADGIIEYKSTLIGSPEVRKLTFRVEVLGCKWLMRTITDSNASPVVIYEKGFDGTNLYNLSTRIVVTNNTVREQFFGLIESNPVPEEGASFMGVIWLALASKCYLEECSGRNKIQPFWGQDDYRLRYERFEMKATWEYLDANKVAPKTVIYFNDGKYRVRADDGKGRDEFDAPSPYNSGYTRSGFISHF